MVVGIAEKIGGPRILGKYAIYDQIASGGMATVHYGRLLGPEGFSRTVAIKCLHPQFAQDPDFVAMFLDEARMAARIRHPNVVATLDVVSQEKEIFLVMDYVHGESLWQILRPLLKIGRGVPLPIALRIATDALQGLHAAHEARDDHDVPLHIVHRDVSPQNILLGVDGVARIVDFGVAKAGGRTHATRDGEIKGKIGYLAPEQLNAEPITLQADIHSFAIVLWEMVAGKRLFTGATETDIFAAVMKHQVPLLHRMVAGVPAALDSVIGHAIELRPENRYASARDMCIALGRCGTIAQTMEVADWVQHQLKDRLGPRDRMVSTIEREPLPAPSEGPAVSSGVVSSKSLASRAAREEVENLPSESAHEDATIPATAAPVIDDDLPDATIPATASPFMLGEAYAPFLVDAPPPGEPAPLPDRLDPVAPPPPPSSVSRGILFGAAALFCVMLLGAGWGLRSLLGDSTPVMATNPTLPPLAESAAPSAPASATTAAADPTVDPDVSATAPPSASASHPPPVPTHVRGAGAPHPPWHPSAKPNCNPPYTLDAQGVRVPKRECFH